MTGLYTAIAAIVITVCAAAMVFIVAVTTSKRTRDEFKLHPRKNTQYSYTTTNDAHDVCSRQNAMVVPYRKLSDNATAPTYGSACAAGADLRALLDEPVAIEPHQTLLVHTGISMAIPDGYVGLVYARSGIALKRNLAPANKVGVIDSDYRGEIMVALHNHGDYDMVVEPGERDAQIVIAPYMTAKFNEVASLDETQRGTGGYGSTGTK